MISALLMMTYCAAPMVQEPETVKPAPVETEIAAALEVANRKNQRVLLIWGEQEGETSEQLDALLADNRELAHKLQMEYRTVRVRPENAASYGALAKKYGVILEKGSPHLTILAAEGLVLANEPAARLMEGGQFEAKKLQALLERHQAPYKDSKVLLDAAITKAEAQQKRVFLAFETTNCEACQCLDARLMLPDVNPLLDKEFIVCWIDVERTIGGKEMLEFLRGGKAGETPWYVVLQPTDRAAVVDSDDVNGKNIGCPKTEEELEAWSGFLKRAKQYLTDEELTQVVNAFKKAAGIAEKEAGTTRGDVPPRN